MRPKLSIALSLPMQVKSEGNEYKNIEMEIYTYQEQVANEVEAYNSNLTVVKERINNVCAKVLELMKDGHMVDIIRQKQQMTEELREFEYKSWPSFEPTSKRTLIINSEFINSTFLTTYNLYGNF